MYRFVFYGVLLFSLVAVDATFGQSGAAADTSTTSCTFADGQQISMRYQPDTNPKQEPPDRGVWGPSGSPMYLFTQTKISLGNTEIPIGAYSVYLTGKKGNWTLIVNKNVAPGAKYDEAQDLVRVPMQTGKLSSPEKVIEVYFAHAAPQECNLRIYYQDTGYFASFLEK